MRTVLLTLVTCLFVPPAPAQYSGGSGTADDPYQIATAADLMALGETPDDYDKHFILTADIDLDPNLPGRKVFETALIGSGWGTDFVGTFNGNGHRIVNMTISGASYLGLFGSVGFGAEITDLGLECVSVVGGPGWVEVGPLVSHFRASTFVAGLVASNNGSIARCYCVGTVSGEDDVGGLVGANSAAIADSYCTGTISGDDRVGGLVATNSGSIAGSYSTGIVSGGRYRVGGLVGSNDGSIADSYSTGAVSGSVGVGGLVGSNRWWGSITASYSTGPVSGDGTIGGLVGGNHGTVSGCCSTAAVVEGRSYVGGLVGDNGGSIASSYSMSAVSGDECVGGLVGDNEGSITSSYSTSTVSGSSTVGGLAGINREIGRIAGSYSAGSVSGDDKGGGLLGDGRGNVLHSVWDTETSGLVDSHRGIGLTTAEMMDSYMLGLNGFGNDPNWVLDAGRDYPRLAWEDTVGQIIPEPNVEWLEGEGTPQNAYRIDRASQLIALARASFFWDKQFVLGSDIDLDPNLPGGRVFTQAVVPEFYGVLDGNNLTISHVTIVGQSSFGLGLFGQLYSGAEVRNLGVVDVNIVGSTFTGGLAGDNRGGVVNCYSTGTLTGDYVVGGLVAANTGSIADSSSSSMVWGDHNVGGLVGINGRGSSIVGSYTTGTASGSGSIGGLAGWNGATINQCWSSATVAGSEDAIGGLAGSNSGNIAMSYSAGTVTGNRMVGGLVGDHSSSVRLMRSNFITACYSTAKVSGNENVGGLVGGGTVEEGTLGNPEPIGPGSFIAPTSFWDMETSGQSTSFTGPGRSPRANTSVTVEVTGLTTAEMQTAGTFLEAGWDFVDETENGTDDIWWILEGKDYPQLWWEAVEE